MTNPAPHTSSTRLARAWPHFALLLVAFGLNCDSFRSHQEPRLILDKTTPGLPAFLGCPTLSRDGSLLYYLEDTVHNNAPAQDLAGDLRAISLVDSSDRLLLSGRFHSLALSRDGQRIALISGWLTRLLDSAPMFVLLDTGVSAVESVFVDSSTRWSTYDASFSNTGEELFFNILNEPTGSTSYYAIRLASREHPRCLLTLPGTRYGFDLLAGDSIYSDTLDGSYPCVNPVDDRWVFSHWAIWDRTTGGGRALDRWSKPHSVGDRIPWACWTLDGRSIIFAAFMGGGIKCYPLGIWQLDNIIEP